MIIESLIVSLRCVGINKMVGGNIFYVHGVDVGISVTTNKDW